MRPTELVIEHRRRRSIRSRFVTILGERLTAPYLRKLADSTFGPDLAESMARLDALAGRVAPPGGTRTEPVSVRGIGAEWVYGPGVPRGRASAILYLHGGGWFFGGLNSHRRLVARISQAAGIPALTVDYRMVPAVSLSEVVEDCVIAYRWLLDAGLRPGQIVIMGDSAGGHLTVAAALRARDEGLPVPASLVGLSGLYDLDTAAKSAHANASADAVSMAALTFLLEGALAGADAFDPALSPVRAQLAGLPPVLLTASSSEILYADSEDLARLLADAGVACTLHVWEHQLHVFQAFGHLLPESRRSIREIGEFVRRSTSATP